MIGFTPPHLTAMRKLDHQFQNGFIAIKIFEIGGSIPIVTALVGWSNRRHHGSLKVSPFG